MDKQREEFLIKHKDCIDFLKTLGLNKIEFDGNNQIIGITRQSHCSLTFREIELMMRTWHQAQKVAVPEGFVLVSGDTIRAIHFTCDLALDSKAVYRSALIEVRDALSEFAEKIEAQGN